MMIAGLDPGWTTAIGTLLLGTAAIAAIVVDRRYRSRQDKKKDAEEKADAPAKELAAQSSAAEALARAAAAIVTPLQDTIARMSQEHGALREAVERAEGAEERCKEELSKVRDELASTKSKLREVTDLLHIAPNGDEDPPD